MFVIFGATGNTGSVVAQTLLDKGQPVRVVVRSAEKGQSWKEKGAEVVVADLLDGASLERALKGAKGAYFLLPPDLQSEHFIDESILRADTIVLAAEKARLPHAVVLSSVGAQHEDGVGPISTIAYLEKRFVEAAIPLTAIRPGYFLENIQDALPMVMDRGVYPSMILPLDRKIDMVGTHDIGLAIADALVDTPRQNHRVIELKGADQYSAEDIAQSFSNTLNRKISPIAVPFKAQVDILKDGGVSEQSARSLVEMHENICNGRIDFLDQNARRASLDLDTYIQGLVA